MMLWAEKRSEIITASLLLLGAFFFYVYTAAPNLYEGDSAEVTAAVVSHGVIHSTGFPLYTMLAQGFLAITSFLDPAYALNIFSALLTALTLLVVYIILNMLYVGRGVSLLSVTILGLGDTIWSHAGAARVYPLTGLFVALLILIVLMWSKKKEWKYIYFFATVLGIAFGNHIVIAVMGLFPLAYLWKSRDELHLDLRRIGTVVALFALPFLQYIYLLFAYRSITIPYRFGDLSSIDGFIYFITQEQYAGKIATRTIDGTLYTLLSIAKLVVLEHGFVIFFIGLIGLTVLFRKHTALFWGIILSTLGNIIIMLGYGNEADRIVLYRYLFPIHIMLTIGIAFGIRFIIDVITESAQAKRTPKWLLPSVLGSTALLITVFMLVSNWEHNNRRLNTIVPDYAENILISLEPRSLVITTGDVVNGSLEYKAVQGETADHIFASREVLTEPTYIAHAHALYPEVFPQVLVDTPPLQRFNTLIALNILKRPVYTTFPPRELDPRFGIIPLGVVFKIVPINTDINYTAIKERGDALWNNYTLRGVEGGKFNDVLIQEVISVYAYMRSMSGVVAKNYGDITSAHNAFTRALAINPDDADAKYQLLILPPPLPVKQ